MRFFQSVIISMIFLTNWVWAQHIGQGYLVDDFPTLNNDNLLGHVDNFNKLLARKKDSQGIVVLYGNSMQLYLMQRRIEGCYMMMHQPINMLKFVFVSVDTDFRTKFYAIPLTETVAPEPPNFKLQDLKKPIELNQAFSTDEFCPLHFDLNWYSRFMTANPTFLGRVVIDSSKKEFVQRVAKYREELKNLGVVSSRVRFSRRHFLHERDEQWWLVPAKANKPNR